jgi:hypothetical protein
MFTRKKVNRVRISFFDSSQRIQKFFGSWPERLFAHEPAGLTLRTISFVSAEPAPAVVNRYTDFAVGLANIAKRNADR